MHIHLCFQKLNIRCIPYDVMVSSWIMSDRQRDAVARLGFSSIFGLRTDALESRSLIRWLMDKLDPHDMTIRPGAGKELKITKDTVHLILGLPCAGGGREFTDWYGEVDAAAKLRRDLNVGKEEFDVVKLQDKIVLGNDDELSIRCFFLILFNRLLFPSASWGITNNEVLMTSNMARMADIDWCQLVYTDLCDAATRWHKRNKTNITTTIYGCSLIVLVSNFFCLLCIYMICKYLLCTNFIYLCILFSDLLS
jgi:hypothetical protein